MSPTAKHSILFLAGFVVQPLSIVLHELRHYAAASCLGYKLRAMERLRPPGARLIPFACLLGGACAGGAVWLNLVGSRLLP
jgi:hypothetical protein